MLDFIIVGQGLAGTWLSYYLQKAGASILVLDDPKGSSATGAAGGIINPVTGRRFIETWMIDELFPFLVNAYTELGELVGARLLAKKSGLLFFTHPEARLAFQKAVEKNTAHIHFPTTDNPSAEAFHAAFGTGEIEPLYVAALDQMTSRWREKLLEWGIFRADQLDEKKLEIDEGFVCYENIKASKIIFCNGAAASRSSYFDKLPFSVVKGEGLILQIPGLSTDFVYKRQFMLSPLSQENHFWWGGGYEWEFENDQPTATFYDAAIVALKDWLLLPYSVKEHRAGIRPATFERRPFVGMHPHYPRIGIFNGLGTKGCSLAPFFAHQFASHLMKGTPLQPEVSIDRFERVLRRE